MHTLHYAIKCLMRQPPFGVNEAREDNDYEQNWYHRRHECGSGEAEKRYEYQEHPQKSRDGVLRRRIEGQRSSSGPQRRGKGERGSLHSDID